MLDDSFVHAALKPGLDQLNRSTLAYPMHEPARLTLADTPLDARFGWWKRWLNKFRPVVYQVNINMDGSIGRDEADGLDVPVCCSLPEAEMKSSVHRSSHMYVGQQFSTSNSEVSSSPIGTQFVKSGEGKLQVTFIPVVIKPLTVNDFPADTRIQSKYGPATVVRLTSRSTVKSLANFNPQTQVLYVADADAVVRFAAVNEISKA